MSWIYLPKSLSQYRREDTNPSKFERHWIKRKQRRKNYWRLFFTFLLFIFLTFSGTIGKVFFVVIASSSELGLAVSLPPAKSAEYIKDRDKRINIYIDRFNRIVINAITIRKYSELSSIITVLYKRYPDHEPVIIADKNCKARDIEKIIIDIQRCGFKRVTLKTYSPWLL
jgi:biopolymer transport protein ExbD